MKTTEELLQELIDLKKTELHSKKRDRWLHFIAKTLPQFALNITLIVIAILLFQEVQTLLDSIQEPSGWFEQIRDAF